MISVIVIGKNEGERLVACLKSIQTALNALAHEVLYVDSCSTDQSLQTAKALGARCFLLAERKTTAGLGRFVGAKEARGEYLLFLDGDMQLQPGFAEKALMAIAAKGYDGVCGIREDVYLRGGEVVCRNDNYFGCTQERLAPEFGGALMITRDALDACGGWATNVPPCSFSGVICGFWIRAASVWSVHGHCARKTASSPRPSAVLPRRRAARSFPAALPALTAPRRMPALPQAGGSCALSRTS